MAKYSLIKNKGSFELITSLTKEELQEQHNLSLEGIRGIDQQLIQIQENMKAETEMIKTLTEQRKHLEWMIETSGKMLKTKGV